ncbi:SH3 domain-containing protein [Roseibium sp.]|uniref:SH3 domain-containing protein n=1 Tax=Roseibium sp. TaxID=1936156 RepID=UPI003BAE9215
MYFVSVPAAACDDQPGSPPDNASKNTSKTDLRLVETPAPFAAGPLATTETDPSALAARILQLHATSETFERRNRRPPKLVGDSEETAFDIPGVLKRDDTSSENVKLAPSPVPQPDTFEVSVSARSGPSFKALLASTVLAVSAVGSAVFLLIPTSPAPVADSRNVETQVIATEPTIESLIDADRSAIAVDKPTQSDAPSQAEITRAKNRIRDAFAASGTVSDTTATLASSQQRNQVADIGKEQSRLRTSGPDQQGTVSPHVPSSLPRLASTDASTIALPAYAVAAQNDVPAIAEPPKFETGTLPAAETLTEPVTSPQTDTQIEGYPNTGTIQASVNLRQSDDKDGVILTTIPAGTEVRYDSCGTWWCGVSYEGQTGFVGQKFLQRAQ